jgi:hypothetical protein
MTNTPHNLDEGAEESFQFIIGGFLYSMRYPTTEEMDEIAKLPSDEAINKRMYDFVTPVVADGTVPPIQETFKKVNVVVGRRFIKMIRTEFQSTE